MRISNLATGACSVVLLAAGVAYAASLSNADKQFLTTAARTDMIEAHEGQMAQNQASRSDVKDVAKTVVDDHTQSYGELTDLAAKTGVTIPKGINAHKDRSIEQLAHLKGARFDSQFTTDVIATDKQEITRFQHEADHGQDAGVKAYAAKMVPVLQKQLQMAEQCAKAKHS
jgi:putative membrane protein